MKILEDIVCLPLARSSFDREGKKQAKIYIFSRKGEWIEYYNRQNFEGEGFEEGGGLSSAIAFYSS
jgi:hypothetical protein